MDYLFVALGGLLGAVSRFFVSSILAEKSVSFPFSTLVVNLIGCFLMGAVVAFFSLKTNLSSDVKLFLTTGFLGAFTTFSTFGLDTVSLLEKSAFLSAFLYITLSVVCGITGVYVATIFVRWILE